jgi:hypothetical protein
MDTSNRANRNKLRDYVLGVIIIGIAAILVAFAFEQLPIEGTTLGIDWRGLWPGIRNGQVSYSTGLFVSPWSLPFVLPLGFLSMRSGWGILTLFTLGVLIVSVPRDRPRVLPGVLLLAISWPSLRHIADGNFEGFVILGLLLIVYSYREQNPFLLALGSLLATAKLQETWILIIVLALYLISTWPRRKLIAFGFTVAAVVVPTLVLFGPLWLNKMLQIYERGSIMDITLSATLNRMGIGSGVMVVAGIVLVGVTAYVVLTGQRAMTREKAGMLVALSLLLAAYGAGNSFLTVLAIGIIPLFQRRLVSGTILIVLANLPAIFPIELAFNWGASYWTLALLITWSTLGWYVYREEHQNTQPRLINEQLIAEQK